MIHEAPATLADVAELVLRQEDSKEVSEGWREHLAATLADSPTVAYRDASGALLGLFGLVWMDGRTVSPWLLCSEAAEDHSRDVLRMAKRWVSILREGALRGGFIFNHIPKDSVRNRAFIQHLGFRIVPSPGNDRFDLFYLPPCALP